jgi:hypothetical protein
VQGKFRRRRLDAVKKSEQQVGSQVQRFRGSGRRRRKEEGRKT